MTDIFIALASIIILYSCDSLQHFRTSVVHKNFAGLYT